MFRSTVLLVVVTLVAAVSGASIPLEDYAINPLLDGRIVGGSRTDISKHPHQCSLRYKACATCSFNHRCGGSIITSKLVLTAAHCVVNIAASKLNIVAAANERNGPGVIVPVVKVISHEDYYKTVPYENDIALLVLGADLPLNDFNIKPIELADKQPDGGKLCTVTGWGTTIEGSNPSDYLMEVDVNIISNDVCESNYDNEGLINDSMLCAGTPGGGKDACQGDSGGPLVVNGLLTGIVSWGYGCARPEYPGVYSSVPNLREWIDNAINSTL